MAGYEWNLGGLEHDLEQLKSLLNICRLQCSRLWELEEGAYTKMDSFSLASLIWEMRLQRSSSGISTNSKKS
jgi:hypothetical protein